MRRKQSKPSRRLRVLPAQLIPVKGITAIAQRDCILPLRIRGNSYVYQLVDPITGGPQYVGISNDPRRRLSAHAKAADQQISQRVYDWWRDVLKRSGGWPPVMRIIEGPIRDDAITQPTEHAEVAWLLAHDKAGIKLVNSAPGGRTRSLKEKVWTFFSARDEVLSLVGILGLGCEYPTQAQFLENDLSGLYSSIAKRFGGQRHFAKKLGLSFSRRENWNVRTARTAVNGLVLSLDLGSTYPTYAQFKEGDLEGLWQTIHNKFGGHQLFADQLNFRIKRCPRWGAVLARDEVLSLVRLCNLGNTYPSYAQFLEHGRSGLYKYIWGTAWRS
jgi:hypothetical protein